eukprot:651754-Pelagomonas_calceolata.AAC.2
MLAASVMLASQEWCNSCDVRRQQSPSANPPKDHDTRGKECCHCGATVAMASTMSGANKAPLPICPKVISPSGEAEERARNASARCPRVVVVGGGGGGGIWCSIQGRGAWDSIRKVLIWMSRESATGSSKCASACFPKHSPGVTDLRRSSCSALSAVPRLARKNPLSASSHPGTRGQQQCSTCNEDGGGSCAFETVKRQRAAHCVYMSAGGRQRAALSAGGDVQLGEGHG